MNNEQFPEGTTEAPSTSEKMSTRRQFIRTSSRMAAMATLGSAILSACGGSDKPAAAAPVKLLLGDGAVKASLLNQKTKPTNPDDIAELEVLQAWLAKNKNVTITYSAIALDTDQKIQAAIAARNCPAFTYTFTSSGLNRAAATGHYAADVTDLYHQYNVDSLLADYAKPYWQNNFNIDGKYYSAPGDAVTAGAGLYYRRDLLQEKGIPDPQFGWTWDDLYSLLKKFQTNGKPVMGVPSYMIGYYLNSNMLDPVTNGGLMGAVPAPKDPWHWKVNVTPWADEWKTITNNYRKWTTTESLIEQNATAYPWEGLSMAKYAAGVYPFSPGFAFQATISGYAPTTPVDMPKKFNKSFGELVGFVNYPQGSNGAYNSSIYPTLSGQMLFPSYLKKNELGKAFDLYLYRIYGEGYTNKYARVYDLTKDPSAAFKFIAPANRYQKNPKLPADVTIEKVYGQFVKSYMDAVINFPAMPVVSNYLPADKQTGPTSTAHDDLISKLSSGKEDVQSVLATYQQTYNQQASSLTSDISPDQFADGTKKYFAAMDNYFKTNNPKFHDGDWTKYYQNYVLPALS